VVLLLSVCSVSNSATMVCFVDGSVAKQATLLAVARTQPHSVTTLNATTVAKFSETCLETYSAVIGFLGGSNLSTLLFSVSSEVCTAIVAWTAVLCVMTPSKRVGW
jgi:prepilin-type processing-associated H-X9-DG protein